MKKFIIAAGLTVGLVNIAQAGLTNPGFITGDFTGWTSSYEQGTQVVTYMESDATDPILKKYTDPIDGHFASIYAGIDTGVYTVLWQTFSINERETISGKAAFISHDWYPDGAYVRITNGTTITALWSSNAMKVGSSGDINDSTNNSFGSTDWEAWSWTAKETGTYTLSFGVANARDNSYDSQALFDVNPVPVPNAMLLLGSGLLGLIGIRRRLQ